jgi:hypothetical protein
LILFCDKEVGMLILMDDRLRKVISQGCKHEQKEAINALRALSVNLMFQDRSAYHIMRCCTSSIFIVARTVDAFIHSSEETRSGNLMERIARSISEPFANPNPIKIEHVYTPDLDIILNGRRYIIEVKSAPNWGNSSSRKKLHENMRLIKFAGMKQDAGNNIYREIVPMLGIWHGDAKTTPETLDRSYVKLEGQAFATFLTGNPDFYLELGDELDRNGDELTPEFESVREETILRLTDEFDTKYLKKGRYGSQMLRNYCENYSPEDAWLRAARTVKF